MKTGRLLVMRSLVLMPLDPRLSVEARVELCAALVIDRAFVHWKMTQALVVEGQSRGRKSATGGSQS
jgi:hypothetical protein